MDESQEIPASEGIRIIKQISAKEKIKTYLKSMGFKFIFPDDEIIISCVRNKVDVFVASSMFEFEIGLIQRCNILQNEYFTKLEFIMEGNFKVCFEY